MYNHITRDDRAIIADGLRRNESYSTIADRIGKDKSTVSREVSRNGGLGNQYNVADAHKKAKDRRKQSKTEYRLLENNTELAQQIEDRLEPLVSPEVVAHEYGIHHQTIYSWIKRSRPDLSDQLPHRGRKRRRYGSKQTQYQGWRKHVRSIHDRPDADDSTPTWEGDTIHGSSKARLVTHVETESLYTKAGIIPDGCNDTLQEYMKTTDIAGSIIYDRGSEFSLWKLIESDLDVMIYFADARSPWQRGVNENTNGRLRRIFPKQVDFASIQPGELADVVDTMNNTPRKSLNWQTPAAVFSSLRCASG